MRMGRKLFAIICIMIIAALVASYAIRVIMVEINRAGESLGMKLLSAIMSSDAARIEQEGTIFAVARTAATTTATMALTGEVEYPSARMLIKAASLELESEDPEATADKVMVIVESYGGYVVKLSTSGREKKSISMIVKVPEIAFYRVLKEVRRIGRVISEDLNVQDATEQYIDLEARLRNLRAEEDWLLAAVEKAQSIQDLIMIEKELWRIRGEIERVEAQLKNLERMTSYSTISIWIRTPEEPAPEPSPYPKVDFTPVLVAAIAALIYVAYGLVFLIIVGAPLSLIAYGVYIIYRRISGRKS